MISNRALLGGNLVVNSLFMMLKSLYDGIQCIINRVYEMNS